MTALIGVKIDEVSTTKEFALGSRHTDENGKEYVYVLASGAIASAGQVVHIDAAAHTADLVETTVSALQFGEQIGVAVGAIADASYGWVQVKGACVIQVAASAAANTALNTTATGGQLDDDASVGAEVIDGLVLTTANGGSAGTAAGFINYPLIGATL